MFQRGEDNGQDERNTRFGVCGESVDLGLLYLKPPGLLIIVDSIAS